MSLGGDMANPVWSPNDPIFFFLHTQIDRLWAAWQAKHPANKYAIGGGVDQVLDKIDQFLTGTG
ncbi:hypothetical protein BOTBODRAFT_372159 [Botryobasidium botryosum FD-172 SS1]|uniref:Tyrosinase copper-binding domain-containing protein n=1 Tax=Botryobasidium botryosum (strain FD-172 SS1) TaxID=930990 RepID=A0A067MN37_BOTB1|nr:hypothetical protein BOTBODRAFT_372159 [Botryobasidium botryosum FD-172 SS1]